MEFLVNAPINPSGVCYYACDYCDNTCSYYPCTCYSYRGCRYVPIYD